MHSFASAPARVVQKRSPIGWGEGVHKLRLAEPNDLRRRLCAQVIDADVYDPTATGPDPGSADIVFDAVGSGATRRAASALVQPGGTIVHTGLQDAAEGLDTRRLTLQEITFVGTYCYKPDDFSHALKLLADGRVTGQGWTEFRPFEDGIRSFQDIDEGRAPPKIILRL